ncbi:TldD/PmbA family protein [Fodinicola acaciae]|uniref:TldD/PmbA family protein n=1 Tax=Fodinicola acaciae TaxID=2681555 RepID=UPI001C9E942C|nr:TldD/PmbA family protein [Fodinicola acaciae]
MTAGSHARHEFDVAAAAVQAALDAGARYADARLMHRRTESMSARDGVVEALVQDESTGLGIRALVGSSWGFAAMPDPTDAEARATGTQATAIAAASAQVPGSAVNLLGLAPVVDSWSNAYERDPLTVSLTEKADLLTGVTTTMREHGATIAESSYDIWSTDKWFVSSEGHRIHQRIVECGAGMSATSVGETETQRRSYPSVRGQFGTAGWEQVERLDLPGNAARIADESRALLTAPACPSGETTLILGSEQMALQIHESVGHAVELDRILGWEAAYAGTSWLDLAKLGSLRFGSDLMTITADATLPGALGSFGYDDEGTPATPVDIVRDGVWTGVLAGRDSASVAGLDYAGAVRSDGYGRLPMVRMTNVGLLPGESTLEEMIAATDDGVYMDTNRSWSIDDRRLNFQFGCEIGYEIKNGRRGRMLRNPTYTGISPKFWGSMDMLGGRDEWIFWGTPNCGKGQPSQIGHTGHPAVPARFTGVRVGVTG